MARIHCGQNKLFIAAGTNIFEYHYVTATDDVCKCPKLVLYREIAISMHRNSNNKISIGRQNRGEGTPEKESLEKISNRTTEQGQILASTLSNDGTMFAVATTSKQCFVYTISADRWNELRPAIRLSKAPTAVIFDISNRFIILSDRAGNVHRYVIDCKKTSSMGTNDGTDDDDEKGNYEGDFLLGHVSMLLNIGISDDQRFMISADRDEKIRISRYPQCYVIHRFCLGHTSYVNSIQTKDNLLFSAGGDGTVRVWNMEDGKQIAKCDCFDGKAIRCCRMFPNSSSKVIKLIVILEQCKLMYIVTFHRETDNFEVEFMTCPEFMVDVAVDSDGLYIFGITRSAIVFGKVGSSRIEAIGNIGHNVLESLRSATDALPALEKKSGYNNVEKYKQRKSERLRIKRRKVSAGST